ncbi:hypothetical protein [Pseudomonas huaxiensis]|uniref:hypothetical protein n=1 Tax=Pseudomonas huaxiensis TaxID=2213017 RepID=UPI000DA6A32F|nr:hypothetical protein [Pseudomonas huaxiensis]
MNRTPAALVLISPLHLRQLLFLSLALLMTLIAGQLYNAWQVKQVDSQLAAQVVRLHESRAVPLQTAPLMRSKALPAATAAAHVPQERWVF